MLLVLVCAACRTPAPGTTLTGAPTPRRSVELFLAAVEAQDLQAMGAVWGTDKGPARDQLDRRQLDQRLIIMQGCYAHDRYEIRGESPGASGKRLVQVSISRGKITKNANFVTVIGPSKRWYVEDADFNTMKDLCRPS
jgi:hypothetical protein